MNFFKFLVVFLVPIFIFANSDVHKAKGYFSVEVKKGGEWQEVKQLSFSEFKSTQKIMLTNDVSDIKLVKIGGGASHIDMVALGGHTPKNHPKLASLDKTLYHVKGDTLLHFPKPGKVFEISARIEPVKISPFAFEFPKVNQFKKIKSNSSFYHYRVSSEKGGQTPRLIFKEKTISGSGHPVGDTLGYAWNDAKNLYVKVDFTPDNTMDGGKDYTAIHIRQKDSVKTFKMSENDKKWGAPAFKKSPHADYLHKVYDYKIPLSEIAVNGSEIQMAFSAYGTASPPVKLTDVNGFDYEVRAYDFHSTHLAGDKDHIDDAGQFASLRINDYSPGESCQTLTKSDDGRMFTCDMGTVTVDTVQVGVKKTFFVPSGKGYARVTATFYNPEDTELSIDVAFANQYATGDTTFHFQKTGGSLEDPGAWVTMDTTKTTMVKLGVAQYGEGDDVIIPTFSKSYPYYHTTWSITIPAKSSKTIISYLTQNSSFVSVTDMINVLYAQSDSEMFMHLSSTTLTGVVNWQFTDNDNDGMIDQWEDAHGLDSSVNDSALDKDGDGLTNLEEFALGSLPNNKDSDADGLEDKVEYDSVPQTDLLDSDSDDDGFHDGDEIFYGSDPLDEMSVPVVSGGTYFVNPKSSSLGNGTELNPWKGFEYALNVLTGGESGTYLLKLSDGVHQLSFEGGTNINVANLTIEGSDNTIIESDPAITEALNSLLILDNVPSVTTIKNIHFVMPVEYSVHAALEIISSDVVIENCAFTGGFRGFYDGVRVAGVSNVSINRSIFIDDYRGVRINGDAGSTLSIRNSFFTSSGAVVTSYQTMARAISSTPATVDFTFEHNTVTDFDGTGLYLDNLTGDTVVRYNLFSNLDVGVYLNQMTDAAKTQIHWNYFNNSTTDDIQVLNGSLYTESNSTTDTDPLLITDSYKLTSISPMIDAIDDATDLVSDDIDGRARPYSASVDNKKDIGCWEYYPNFTVSFVAGEHGSIDGEISQEIYAGDDCVSVTANPDAGYEFDGWTGDYVGSENPLTVTNVAADMTITANFLYIEVPDEDADEVVDETVDGETPDEVVDEAADETIDEAADEIADESVDETVDEVADESADETVDEVADESETVDESPDSGTVDDDNASEESDADSKKKSSGCSTLIV